MKSTYTCTGIICEGCANAIKMVVSKVPGVEKVDVDVPTKVVTVTHGNPATNVPIESALRKAGFAPSSM